MTLLVLLVLAISSSISAEISGISARPEGRITNGETATPGQFPWQAALRILSLRGVAVCGGSLVSEKFVLTAAHCASGAQKIEVGLGSINRTDPELVRKSLKIIVHPKWRRSNLANDLALVRIRRVPLSANVGLVRMPTVNDANRNLTNEIAIASGWGRTSDSATGVTDLLQWVQFPIISNDVCRDAYGNVITDEKICTDTNGGKSTCQGDSGGPLTQQSNQVLVGVTSFGSAEGCEKGKPDAFTRVSKHINWINAIINNPLL